MDIAVIGAGFVGQATGKGLAKHNNKIVFIDVDTAKVNSLKKEGFEAYLADDYKNITTDISMFSVHTPTQNGKPIFDYLENALIQFAKRLKKHNKYHLAVIRSTTLPGFTRNKFIPLIEKYSGKKAGLDFGVCMQPEYLRQATAQSDFDRPWFILIGELDSKSGDTLEKIYHPFNTPTKRVSLEEAEFQKYIHNIFNAVKIAFFNEMREISNKIGVDADNIFPTVGITCEGCWNPIYGLRDYGPYDGACLPKDADGFQAWAREQGFPTKILDSIIEQNKEYEKYYQKKKLSDAKPAQKVNK